MIVALEVAVAAVDSLEMSMRKMRTIVGCCLIVAAAVVVW